jgi:hypothetical protein
LNENRFSVLAVAHALETHKTLAGEDVAAVIEMRKGSVIDGSVYSHASVSEQLEAYHTAALSAHRDHAKPDVGLPVLTS